MDSDDDGSIDEGDLGYFADKRSYSFLFSNLEDEKPSKKTKTTEDDYAERKYAEARSKPEQNVHHMLPIKTDQGLQQRSRIIEKEKPAVEVPVARPVEEETYQPQSVAEIYSLRQQYITKAKQDIAKLSCAITENPYNNIAAMKKLRNYCSTEDSKAGQTVRKLAMISLTAVYNDILPSYSVKPSKELESLSKEVKAQHSYETDLLRNYRVFLDLLFDNLNLAFQTKKEKAKAKVPPEVLVARQNLGLLSLKCMAELLSKNYNFNLRSNIVNTLIPYGASKAMGGQLADVVTATIVEIFEKDKQGECSVEIVRMIAALVKKKGNNVNGKLLECLLHVRLVELGEVKKEKEEKLPDTALLSKKQRKHRKEQAKVRKELLEAEAVENKKKKSRLQSESLDHIFVTYFRILKQFHDTPLLPIALAGLSKFAHLINVDFFTDLFECLKRIIKEETLDLSDSLNCVSTIFTILSGQGSVLDVDIGEFYALLYQNILLFTPDTPSETYHILKQALTNTIKRKVPLSCQMAMVKRLCTMSAHLNPKQSHIFLCEARKLIRSSPRIAQMLESDEEFGKPFYPEASEPGQANAEATVLWELSSIARKSYHESVRTTANHLSRYDPNSTKRSEVDHFLNYKFKDSSQCSILEDNFPRNCKKMQNRRAHLNGQTVLSDQKTDSIENLQFYSDIKANRVIISCQELVTKAPPNLSEQDQMRM